MRAASGYRIAGCMALALLLGLVYLTPFGQRFERDAGLASLYLLRGAEPVPDEAIVIGLDRDSIEWLELHTVDLAAVSAGLADCLGPFALAQLQGVRDVSGLPRGLHGCLIRELTARHARMIAFDILFRVPIPEEDDAFAAEIAQAGNVVLFERIRSDLGKVGAADTLLMRQSPREIFAAAARDTAFFLLDAPSGDVAEGYLRHLADFPDLAPMPEVVLRHYAGSEVPAGQGMRPVWLYGPARSIPTYTLREVFDDASRRKLPPDLSRVAVFVGVSDPDQPGTKDHYKIPISGPDGSEIAGVELAASVFLNLLHGQILREPVPPVDVGVVVLFGFTLMVAARLLPGRRGMLAVVPLTGAYAGLAWAAFAGWQLWLPFAVPVYLGAPLAGLVAIASRYAFARALVTRLAPRQVAGMLLEGSHADRHDAHSEQATVMFTDLVGSTRLGDRLSNLEYAKVISHYYDAANEAIEAHDGMVVEFMGDGVLALFSESVSGPGHAARACEAALALCSALRAKPPPGADGHPGILRLRIGINTGMTATGEIGARHRFNFKALGDTVNVAARLEQYGRQIDDGSDDVILLSHATLAMTGLPSDRFEDLGTVALRGKSMATGVARLRPEPDGAAIMG